MARIYVPSTPATRGEVNGPQRGVIDRGTGLSQEQLEEAAALAGYKLVKADEVAATVDEPKGNASRDDWANFARSKGATDDDLVDADGEELGRDALRERYGAPAV